MGRNVYRDNAFIDLLDDIEYRVEAMEHALNRHEAARELCSGDDALHQLEKLERKVVQTNVLAKLSLFITVLTVIQLIAVVIQIFFLP